MLISSYSDNGQLSNCGGSIISQYHILTAAHCVIDVVYADDVTVRSGSTHSNYGGVVSSVSDIIIHEQYSDAPWYMNDIAIVVLSAPLRFDSRTQKISLPRSPVTVGDDGYISGWGEINTVGQVPQDLRGVWSKVVDPSTCQAYQNEKDENFCAQSTSGDNVCSGDSGGPFAINNQVAGIVSTSSNKQCVRYGYSTRFISVYYYRRWITRNTGIY